MKSKGAPAFIALAFLIAGCVNAGGGHPLRDLWDHPLDYDGQRFDLVVYPYDLLHDRDRYIMCSEPCPSARQANDEPAVIFPSAPGEFDGLHGASPRHVTVIFRANCFRPDGACPHRPFQFEQVGSSQ